MSQQPCRSWNIRPWLLNRRTWCLSFSSWSWGGWCSECPRHGPRTWAALSSLSVGQCSLFLVDRQSWPDHRLIHMAPLTIAVGSQSHKFLACGWMSATWKYMRQDQTRHWTARTIVHGGERVDPLPELRDTTWGHCKWSPSKCTIAKHELSAVQSLSVRCRIFPRNRRWSMTSTLVPCSLRSQWAYSFWKTLMAGSGLGKCRSIPGLFFDPCDSLSRSCWVQQCVSIACFWQCPANRDEMGQVALSWSCQTLESATMAIYLSSLWHSLGFPPRSGPRGLQPVLSIACDCVYAHDADLEDSIPFFGLLVPRPRRLRMRSGQHGLWCIWWMLSWGHQPRSSWPWPLGESLH